MKLHSVALAAATVLAMASAHADTFTLSGQLTTADPVFNRPASLTGLSAVGTAVHYDAFSFVNTTPALYSFTAVSAAFDTVALLYAGSFNPASSLTNLVAYNDDAGGTSNSAFSFNLAAGTTYTFITTAFENIETGAYVSTITSAVPEPESYALMALGVAAIGLAVRRRTRRSD